MSAEARVQLNLEKRPGDFWKSTRRSRSAGGVRTYHREWASQVKQPKRFLDSYTPPAAAANERSVSVGTALPNRRSFSQTATLRNGAWFQANGGAKMSRHGIYDYRKEKVCASNSTSSIAAQRRPNTSTHGRWGIGKGLACDDKYHGRCDQFTWLGVIRPSGKTAVSNVPFAKENLQLPETESVNHALLPKQNPQKRETVFTHHGGMPTVNFGRKATDVQHFGGAW